MLRTRRVKVRYSCGHVKDVPIYGTQESIAARARLLEKMPCPECAKKMQREREERAERKQKLPMLTGPKSMVEWAAPIRRGWFNAAMSEASTFPQPTRRAVQEGIRLIVMSPEARYAKWWVRHRFEYSPVADRHEILSQVTAAAKRRESELSDETVAALGI